MEISRVIDLSHPNEFRSGRAFVVDVTNREPFEAITYEDVAPQIDTVQPGDVVLFNTGWDVYYRTPEYARHPSINPEIIAALLVRGVLAFGIDAPHFDQSEDAPVAELLWAASAVSCVQLANLDAIADRRTYIRLIPESLGVRPTPVGVIAIEYG